MNNFKKLFTRTLYKESKWRGELFFAICCCALFVLTNSSHNQRNIPYYRKMFSWNIICNSFSLTVLWHFWPCLSLYLPSPAAAARSVVPQFTLCSTHVCRPFEVASCWTLFWLLQIGLSHNTSHHIHFPPPECQSSSSLSVWAHQTTGRSLVAPHKPKLKVELKLELRTQWREQVSSEVVQVVFCDVSPRTEGERQQRFARTHYLQLQSRRGEDIVSLGSSENAVPNVLGIKRCIVKTVV